MRIKYILVGIVIGVLCTTAAVALAGTAGTLEPDNPPKLTESYTLEDIYDRLDTGADAAPSAWSEPSVAPGVGTGHTLSETYSLIGKRAFVPDTGQAISYTVGDDGHYSATVGVDWPIPRFITGTTGVVTDTLTGLIWLENANCFGERYWTTAIVSATALNSGECGLSDGSGAGDWRLPNVRELYSLVHAGVHNPAVPNTAGTGRWAEGDPFTGVQSSYYWSSTTYANHAGYAWGVSMGFGFVGRDFKTATFYVWPVRGGQ
jgi:hypothetical protein